MKPTPYWKRSERWLAFFLTLLGVCSFLAMVPVTPDLAPQEEIEEESFTESRGFFDQLREGSRAPRVLGHWTSLAPPMLALLIALYFRSMVFALLTAFVAGGFFSFGLNPLLGLSLALHDFIWETLSSFSNLYIILFLFTLVGLVHLISRNGGLAGLVTVLGKLATSRRRAQISVGVSGLAIFFDDYSNTVILGNTMRRLSDKWRISREKLAYLVDSTTVPVAGLAVLSTWIAAEAMLLGSEAENLGIELSGYSIFIELLPMRFYCLGTLIFLFINAGMGREFGSMYQAETRASMEGKLLPDEGEPLGIQSASSTEPKEEIPRRALNAIIPLAIVITGIVVGILLLGSFRMGVSGESFSWTDFGDWRAAFGKAVGDTDSAGAVPILLAASFLGSVAAFGLTIGQRLLSVKEAVQTYVSGMPTMWMAIFILLMAWSMQQICQNLGTAQYLIDLLGDRMPIWTLPIFTFGVAAMMSFATGTSWGAMGILIPIILPLAHGLGAFDESDGLIFFLTVAAILDGAIFGDHCSPISDTTVLTSISTGCDHITHVKTQLPYAFLTMTFSGLFGYLAVAQKFPIWVFYLLFPISVYAVFKTFGRPIPESD